jgi:cell division septum initiation protein DivIVA
LSERDAELERQQQKAEKLRKQLENLETSIKRKREQQDEGDEMRAVDASPVSSSDSKSDDEKPETLSTREQMVIPPAAKKADQTKHCKYFSTGGVCGKKGKCRFVHDLEVRTAALQERERNGGRMTLQQRLILNDKEQEDLTIVKTLAYLQGKGMISGSTKSNTETDSETTAQSQPEQSGQAAPRTLPPAPVKREQINHSLPAIPPAPISQGNASAGKRYEGWNLSGFGNTGVKAGDI